MMKNEQADVLAMDNKIVIVLAQNLDRAGAANRCAVLATGLGKHHPQIVGDNAVTADGQEILGFTQIPIAILAAQAAEVLPDLEHQARDLGCVTLVFLTRAQGVRSYSAYLASIRDSESSALDIDALLIYGPKKKVNKMTGGLSALC